MHEEARRVVVLGEAMSKVSVLIPCRFGTDNNEYLTRTIKDLYTTAAGEIEVIVVLDGPCKGYKSLRYKGLTTLRNKTVKGRRYSTNKAAAAATGKYIMKIDAHCTIGEGWDEILAADCADNWIVIPRRYWFDAPTWSITDKKYVDAMSYIYPFYRPYKPRLAARPDRERQERDKDKMLVEDMGFQGSAWFMTKEHWERIGEMDEYGYGTFYGEPEEIGLKTQLGPSGGKVMRNKNTWYAHWGKPPAHWRANPDEAGRVTDYEFYRGQLYTFDYWWNNRWNGQVRNFDWLIERFWPLPGWPDNWRWLEKEYNRYDRYSGYAMLDVRDRMGWQ